MKLILVAALLTATSPTPSYNWKLTPSGWGPVRIGMSRDQVSKALHVELKGDAFDNEGHCIDLYSDREELKGTFFMFIDGKLSRISVVESNRIATPKGIHVGATKEEVRKAYGSTLEVQPHYYLGEPAEYLTFWLKPKARGVRFETDAQQKVETIHAGDDSIELVESCN